MYRGTSEPGAVEAGSRHPSPQLKLRRDARWVPAQSPPAGARPAAAPGGKPHSARARAGPGPRGERPAPRRTHISPGPALVLVAPTGRPNPASAAGPAPPHPRGDPGAAAAQETVGEEVGVRLPPCPAALPPPPAEGRQSRPAPRRGREVTHRRRLRAALSSAEPAVPARSTEGKLWAALGGARLRRAGPVLPPPPPAPGSGAAQVTAALRHSGGSPGRGAGRRGAPQPIGAGRGGPRRSLGPGCPRHSPDRSPPRRGAGGAGPEEGPAGDLPRAAPGPALPGQLSPPARALRRCRGTSSGGSAIDCRWQLHSRLPVLLPSAPPLSHGRASGDRPTPTSPRAGPAALPPPVRRFAVGPADMQRGGQEPTGPVSPPLSPRGRPGAAAGAQRGVAAALRAPPRLLPAGVLAVLCACPAPPQAGLAAGHGGGLRLRSRAARGDSGRRHGGGPGAGEVRGGLWGWLNGPGSSRSRRGLSDEQGPRGLRSRVRVAGPSAAAGAQRCASVCSGAVCGPCQRRASALGEAAGGPRWRGALWARPGSARHRLLSARGECATQGCAAWAVSSDKTSEPSLRELQQKINKILLRNGENPLLKKKKNQLFL